MELRGGAKGVELKGGVIVRDGVRGWCYPKWTLLMSETSFPSGGYQFFCLAALSFVWMLNN